MSSLKESFSQSAFSQFTNSPAGRLFRLAAGAAFLIVGFVNRDQTLGVVSMVWSIFPLSAGAFDVCYISAALGGPFSGKKIRDSHTAG